MSVTHLNRNAMWTVVSTQKVSHTIHGVRKCVTEISDATFTDLIMQNILRTARTSGKSGVTTTNELFQSEFMVS